MFLVLLMPWHAAMTKNKSLSVFLILLMRWYAAVWLRMGYVSVSSFATNVSLCRARFSWYSREHLNSVHLRSMDCPLIERMSTAHRSLLLPPSQGLNRTVRHCRSVSYLLDVASLASSRRDASSFTIFHVPCIDAWALPCLTLVDWVQRYCIDLFHAFSLDCFCGSITHIIFNVPAGSPSRGGYVVAYVLT